MPGRLEELLTRAAARWPRSVAVEDPDRLVSITFGELDNLSDRLATSLLEQGVNPGDRVGIWAPKSIDAVAWIFAILKARAAYVPVDAEAPLERGLGILADCGVSAVVAGDPLSTAILESGDATPLAGRGTVRVPGTELSLMGGPAPSPPAPIGDDLAYILYTSGSTGMPKGVMHTHASALSFVDWCSDTFEPRDTDRFSSHAPFHFDLSIFDLYVSLKHGATVVLIGEESGKYPARLATTIAERAITVWYSTPTVLRLLVEYGHLDRIDHWSLRLVLFAGEVFPVGHLRRLMAEWSTTPCFNLYGPTETNVCTWYRVPDEIPEDRFDPYPIGVTCSPDRTKIVDEGGREVVPGEEGELVVAGGTVMAGYWNQPDKTNASFLIDDEGGRWYRTGDLVRENDRGDFEFLGRRDRMVKRRGYRVELGEIEAALYRHPLLVEGAVVAVPDEESGVRVVALLTWEGDTPSLLALKRFSARHLPAYMIPDQFISLDELPKTSSDKIDYQGLTRLIESMAPTGPQVRSGQPVSPERIKPQSHATRRDP